MKQIIPFEKEIPFKTMIGEITSISLEHTLEVGHNKVIKGDFIVGGSYKLTEASQLEEEFTYHIPCEISINEDYDVSNVSVAIDDFYYEILNEDTLKVNIDVLIDGLEYIKVEEMDIEKDIEEPVRNMPIDEEVETILEELEEEMASGDNQVREEELQEEKEEPREAVVEPIPVEVKEEKIPLEIPVVPSNAAKEEKSEASKPSLTSLFDAFKDSDETFSTYYVYIVREEDTIDGILDKYQVNRDDLALYNNLENVVAGMKLVIPSIHHE